MSKILRGSFPKMRSNNTNRDSHTNRNAPTQTKGNGCDFPHLPVEVMSSSDFNIASHPAIILGLQANEHAEAGRQTPTATNEVLKL
jgi:hypothetical protein